MDLAYIEFFDIYQNQLIVRPIWTDPGKIRPDFNHLKNSKFMKNWQIIFRSPYEKYKHLKHILTYTFANNITTWIFIYNLSCLYLVHFSIYARHCLAYSKQDLELFCQFLNKSHHGIWQRDYQIESEAKNSFNFHKTLWCVHNILHIPLL